MLAVSERPPNRTSLPSLQRHLSEILGSLNGEYLCASGNNDNIDTVVQQIKGVREQAGKGNRKSTKMAGFSKETVLPQLIRVLESG